VTRPYVPLISASGAPTRELMRIENIDLPSRTVDDPTFGAIRDAVARIPGFRLRAVRKPMVLEYVIAGSWLLLSWGEVVQVHCGGGRIEIRSFVRCPIQLIDWGRNAYNVARVKRAVCAVLAAA
jgi:hypothetical protein